MALESAPELHELPREPHMHKNADASTIRAGGDAASSSTSVVAESSACGSGAPCWDLPAAVWEHVRMHGGLGECFVGDYYTGSLSFVLLSHRCAQTPQCSTARPLSRTPRH